MIRAYKREILYFVLLSSFITFVYLLCDWQQNQKIVNFLASEKDKYSQLGDVNKKSLILKEVKRRAFYYFFHQK
ncbi:hypothetical protein MJH12_15030, partial [bacterium]|nr:hypothetical protein [bacterium]